MANLLSVCAAAHVKEIRRRPARIFDDVHRRHGQPGAVYQTRNIPIQLDVIQAVL
jgi:hypothetical protein